MSCSPVKEYIRVDCSDVNENNVHEIDTNMVSLRPYFEKHGQTFVFVDV